MTFTYLCFFLTLHVIIVISSEDTWCYDIVKSSAPHCPGPREWKTLGSCGKSEQSPINIVTKNTEFKKTLKAFHFSGYDAENDLTIANNGHSAQLSLEGKGVTISGGGLDGTYTALQFHFHWGSIEMHGSEHSIDGERYPAELHIVHKAAASSRSSSGGETTGSGRTLAVLGFFIEQASENNPNYNSIVAALNDIRATGTNTTVSKVKLQGLIPEEKYLEHFYRYDGSLTTPMCDETVTWTVFPETIKLGKSQLEAFYTKLNYSADAVMEENFRPIQELGVRKVYTSGKPWCYEVQLSPLENCRGPGEWTSIDSCDGNEQSPINIVSKEAELDKSLSPLKFINYDSENDFVLTNNGHSAELFLEENEITISEGGLQGTYKAKQLHFHWGNSGTLGSEHSKDGRRFAAELHIVHTLMSSSRSESGGDITGEGRTIAVLAFFIEESEENNSKYDGIIQALNDIRSKDLRTTVSQVKLQELIPEKENLTKFYRYDGSLTTPGCAEIVTWTVFYETIKLGKSQLEAFYTKLNYSADAVMVENFRPIQKLGVRKVYTSGVEAVVSHSRHLLLSFIVAFVVLMF
ncbi:carbonic anhydrase 4 isoform X2 [Rana temporaria]|uniref:carbonic anhydrase 4 isoform X2 n=1 Tax=Rana temporaria TaxID=8407 RepID=UPI001AAD5139|nr:carbonic anhydrase 4 isoform X2 [Rana temporaria]